MRIGVVGYSQQEFDKEKVIELLRLILIQQTSIHLDITIVSGLTNLGVPAIAYSLARELNLKTMGVACAKAGEYECFPCNRVHIVGKNWGDESETFLASIDKLIRIGGGKQSHAEAARAKKLGLRVIEVELDALIDGTDRNLWNGVECGAVMNPNYSTLHAIPPHSTTLHPTTLNTKNDRQPHGKRSFFVLRVVG